MTLYIDNKLIFPEKDVISTVALWHSSLPLLAVGSYCQEKGGFVTIFQQNGYPIEGCEWPTLFSNQVTTLAWHPTRKFLVAGWDGGEIFIWLESTWAKLEAPHQSSISLISFSSVGNRLVTADLGSSLCGWNSSTGAPLTSYHHQLTSPITHVAFCPVVSGQNLRGFARAADASDGKSLDALAAWRPRTTARVGDQSRSDNPSCYAVQENGTIVYIDGSGEVLEVLKTGGTVQFIQIIRGVHLLVACDNSGTLIITKYNIVSNNGSLIVENNVRMSSRSGQSIIMIGDTTVAIIAGETVIRLWDAETSENDILPIDNTLSHADIFTSIGYSAFSDTLCCGTAQGNLYFWRKDPRNEWKLISSTTIKGTVKDVCWGSKNMVHPLLAVNCITKIFTLEEQFLCWGYSSQVWSVQRSAHEVEVGDYSNKRSMVTANIKIKSLAFKNQYLAIADGEKVEVWSNTKDYPYRFSLLHSFTWKADVIIIHEEILVGVVSPYIECRSISGNPLGILPNAEGEGEPIGITITNKYVVIATIDGCLKVCEITRKGIDLAYPLKNCYQSIEDFGEVMHASVNSTGQFICLSVANSRLAPDPRIYLWDCSKDIIESYSVIDDVSSFQFVPISICWDDVDPRILIVHMRSIESDSLHLYFCDDSKLYEHKDWYENNNELNTEFVLCGLCAPNVLLLKQQKLVQMMIKEFTDIKQSDTIAVKQVLNFLHDMSIGELEDAVLIATRLAGGKSVSIWTSLAKACVLNRKPDIGAICLSKMNDLKGSMMLRQCMVDTTFDIDSQTGILALNLNMLKVAEQLFRESKRYDLVARLYSGKGSELNDIPDTDFEGEAMLIKRSVQYQIATTLKNSGEINEAIQMYEKCDAVIPHIPRMLLSVGQNTLAQYVSTSKDIDVIRWWGNYLESLGDIDGALEAYSRIEDFASQTRLLSHMQRDDDVEKICYKDNASIYQRARYLEMKDGHIEKAVKLYLQCGVVSAALRLAMEVQDPNLIWKAGIAKPSYAMIAAEALQNLGEVSKAISLLQNAGEPLSALQLALTVEDFNAACDSVEAACNKGRIESSSIMKPAQILRDAGYHSHAAALLANAGQYGEALDALEMDSSSLTEELAEKLAAPPGTDDRETLLKRLADILGSKGLYREAARRLAQAGDKSGALRWLLRSGDADRVCTFALASRDKIVQQTAAGYLRSHTEWHSHPDVHKQIIQLYMKAKAYDQLASFHAEAAKLVIEEYGEFEKAFDYMKDAIKCIGKSANPELGRQLIALQEQCALLKKVIELRSLLENGDIRAGLATANQLLNVVTSRPGLLSEQAMLRLLVEYCSGTPDGKVFADRLSSITSLKKQEDDNQSIISNDQSIEEYV